MMEQIILLGRKLFNEKLSSQFNYFVSEFKHITELQIREGIEDNSKIIFLISQRKHILRPFIRTVLARRF